MNRRVCLTTLAAGMAAQAGSKATAAPAIGSSVIFGTAESRLRHDIDLTAPPFNMRPGVDANQFQAWPSALPPWNRRERGRRSTGFPPARWSGAKTENWPASKAAILINYSSEEVS